MSNIDWSMLRRAADIAAEELEVYAREEALWVELERKYASERLEAIEDGEDIHGTERQWRDYRIQVRAWKPGAEGFPSKESRPVRP